MSADEQFDAPDADVILRALGSPIRDFRVHKLVLSLASPVFKEMFSLSQPTSPASEYPSNSGRRSTTQIDIVEVAHPSRALEIVLRMVYPFTPPSFNGNLDVVVECLTITEEYGLRGATLQLYTALSRFNGSQALRVYAIASRFGYSKLMESASHQIHSSVNLTGVPQLPDDFQFVPATTYHKLVRQHASYLEAVVEIIRQTPLKSGCYSCPGGKRFAEEVFRARLTHIVMRGTPVEASACLQAWKKAYGHDDECENDCVAKFICTAVVWVEKRLAKPGTPPARRKSIARA